MRISPLDAICGTQACAERLPISTVVGCAAGSVPERTPSKLAAVHGSLLPFLLVTMGE